MIGNTQTHMVAAQATHSHHIFVCYHDFKEEKHTMSSRKHVIQSLCISALLCGTGCTKDTVDTEHSFMYDPGAIMPVISKDNGIQAQRTLTLDCITDNDLHTIHVNDTYILTSDQDISTSVLIPFVSDINSLPDLMPTVEINGETAETTLHAGRNTESLTGWQQCREWMNDNAYIEKAMQDAIDLSDMPVTVYTFRDPWGEQRGNDIPNPTIRVLFEMDYEKTSVISYGFHAGLNNPEEGIMGRGFSIPQTTDTDYGRTYTLIVIGDDIENMTIQGYNTGGWDTEKTIEAGVSVETSLNNLEKALYSIAKDNYDEMNEDESCFGLYFCLLKDMIFMMKNQPLEDIEILNPERIFLLEVQVHIPESKETALKVSYEKETAYDFAASSVKNPALRGIRIVNLNNGIVQSQRLELTGADTISIVSHNTGPDLSQNITDCELSNEIDRYYLDIQRKK